jgi:hypothetical protein
MPDTHQHPPPMKDEPEPNAEESVPSDGKDREGEKMMEELGRDKPGKPLAPEGTGG